MTTVVNTHDAKTQLSKLLRRVEAGEEIVIARDGRPVARLVPVLRRGPVKFGTARGQVRMTGDAFAPMTEAELAEWYDAPLEADPTDEPSD